MDAKEILKRPYARRLTPQEGGGFMATIQEFPGCIAEGRTANEALVHLEEAAESWLDALIAQGGEIPEPIDFHGYSGKIALRIPRGLHKQAAELALSEGTSINQLLTSAIAGYFGAKQALRYLTLQFTQNNVTLINVGQLHLSFEKTAKTIGSPEPQFKLPRMLRPQVAARTSNG